MDATVTLMRRLLRGDKVYEAHRSHGYQFASRLYGKHLPVTLAVLVINLVWLLPLACLAALGGRRQRCAGGRLYTARIFSAKIPCRPVGGRLTDALNRYLYFCVYSFIESS